MVHRVILALILVITAACSNNYEIKEYATGYWEISNIDRGSKIYFGKLWANNLMQIDFQNDNTVFIRTDDGNINNMYFSIKENILTVSTYFTKNKHYYHIEQYKIGTKLSDSQSYGKICYEFTPIKISGGVISKNKLKICRDKKRYVDITY